MGLLVAVLVFEFFRLFGLLLVRLLVWVVGGLFDCRVLLELVYCLCVDLDYCLWLFIRFCGCLFCCLCVNCVWMLSGACCWFDCCFLFIDLLDLVVIRLGVDCFELCVNLKLGAVFGLAFDWLFYVFWLVAFVGEFGYCDG